MMPKNIKNIAIYKSTSLLQRKGGVVGAARRFVPSLLSQQKPPYIL